jgi:hypothetical protein
VKNTNPELSNVLSRRVRAEGRPDLVAVASVIVSGRGARLPAASRNHRVNCLNGSELTLDSSRLSVSRPCFSRLSVALVPR